ncbi:HNHc domain-containing protein [Fusarium keratoplasticum]|nr:HNHc domain-containing protein [Fusarium keratoplasticum]
MHPALPLHRHQSSLEGIIDFSAQPPLTPAQRLSAGRRFNQLVNHFDVPDDSSSKGYDRVKLVRLTYDYARSEESKGNFLRAFFEFAELPINGDEDIDLDLGDADRQARLRDFLFNFAEYLFQNFFLPLKASTKKTPQPSPASHSAIQRAQGEGYTFSGTPERVSTLRGACLFRDRYRCVISRKFDLAEALKRGRHGGEARDEDGVPLEGQSFDALEVAHILPHSLTQVNANKQLDPSKEAALAILNMFDSGAAFLVEGTEIDRPRNAMTLAPRLHQLFGDFQIFFEPVDQQPHTYRIDTFVDYWLLENLLPVSRTLYLTESKTIDPPSARLLAIHNAIAHILHLSAAGNYIDRILRDLEEHGVREDGSTDLGRFVKLRLNGWPISEVNG